jgi:probable O-glycosylation ligase (exosortase A-associated)
MRDAIFSLTLLALLPLAAARPFVGVLLWSWISFMNPHQLVWGFAGSIPWAQIIFIVTLVGCIAAREPRQLPVNAVTVLLVLLLACVTFTSFVAIGDAGQVWSYWDRVFKIVLGLLLTAALLTDRQRIHALVWVMVICIGYFSFKGGAFSLLTGGGYRIWGPPNTMIGDNNHVATAMLVTLPLMNWLRLHSYHRVVRIGLLVAMGLTVVAVFGTYSRGALLALAAVVAVLWWRSRGKIISGMVLAACLAGTFVFMPPQWTERMQTIVNYEQDESASDRLVVWGISWKIAAARPLTGAGFQAPYQQAVVDTVVPGGQARAVHSIWFMVLGEHGFPTFAVWLALNLAGLFYAFRLTRMTRGRSDLAWAHDLGRMAPVCFAAYAVGGTFLSLAYWDFFWTLLVVLAAAHTVAARKLATGRRPSAAAAVASGWRTASVARVGVVSR